MPFLTRILNKNLHDLEWFVDVNLVVSSKWTSSTGFSTFRTNDPLIVEVFASELYRTILHPKVGVWMRHVYVSYINLLIIKSNHMLAGTSNLFCSRAKEQAFRICSSTSWAEESGAFHQREIMGNPVVWIAFQKAPKIWTKPTLKTYAYLLVTSLFLPDKCVNT